MISKRQIVVYISGKYSGDVEANISVAREKAIQLWDAGYVALCPHLNTAHFNENGPCTYDDFIEGDLQLLSRCDVIYMLEGWDESKGAKIERDFAMMNGIHICYNDKELQEYYEYLNR